MKGVSGVWKDLTDSVNKMADNLTAQVRNIAEVTIAVANGDLSKKVTVDVRGEILQLKEAINTMVDQLNGFASEVTRVAREVGTEGKLGGQAEAQGPVVVLVMDKDQIAHYQKLVSTLRQAGIKAELYLGGSGMKAQMKYADKRGSVCVVIQGSDEREKGEVLIKDLVLGATLSSAPDRDAYLKQQAEAQFAVPETGMIDAVRKVLARHGAKD